MPNTVRNSACQRLDRRSIAVVPRLIGCRTCASSIAWAAVFVTILGASSAIGQASNIPISTQQDVPSALSTNIDAAIAEASQRFGLSPSLIRAVIAAESAGDVRAVSPKGAVGLMQLMPDTFGELREQFGLGADPFDPHDNIMAGAAYLRQMLDRFGTAGFLAAYNAGPERYLEQLTTDRALPEETRSYITKLDQLTVEPQRDVASPTHKMAGDWRSAPLSLRALRAVRWQALCRTKNRSASARHRPYAERPSRMVCSPRGTKRRDRHERTRHAA